MEVSRGTWSKPDTNHILILIFFEYITMKWKA